MTVKRALIIEQQRQEILESLQILDSRPEKAYDDITELASQLSGLPFSMICLIDSKRQWIKSCFGLSIKETPRELAFCNYCVDQGKRLMVPDTTAHPVLKKSPFVVEAPRLASYYGFPLNIEGCFVGTLAVCGDERVTLSELTLSQLEKLAYQVQMLLEQRTLNVKLNHHLKARTKFLTTMSHEVRTPLNGLMGLMQVLAETPLNCDQNQMIQSVISCGNGLTSILDNLLDFDRIDRGESRVRLESFELEKMIRSCSQVFAPLAADKGINLKIKTDPSIDRPVVSDLQKLRQILLNLLNNAIKYTREGVITIGCSKMLTDNQTTINLYVSDTGMGIANEDLQRIFMPYQQKDSSSSRSFDGTGLGLAICAGLIKELDGSIVVESKLGEGSCFSVNFSCQETNFREYRTQQENPLGLHILVAEDNKLNQLVMERMLSSLGCSFKIAANGVEAIDSLEKEEFDICLFDCHMPIMDGYTAVKKIRHEKIGKEKLPIVAVTASVTPDDRARCVASGMDDIIPKPLSKSALKDLLNQYKAAS